MRAFSLLIIIFLFNICVPSVHTFNCTQHDQSSLLQLKHSLVFYSSWYPRLDNWNSSSNCCVWAEITCSPSGDVIGLYLSDQSISGGIDDSNSSLFDLHHLQRLDLSYNHFNGAQIPSAIGKLVNLVHLNLSTSGFGGQVPIEISNLTSLLTLNLGSDGYSRLENLKLSMLVQNLTSLIELRLDGVNMSAEGQWGNALSSSLPNLQVLSLSGCSLSGPLHDSLGKLHALTEIYLGSNDLSSALPDFLANFSNLTYLSLYDCGIDGNFPPAIFRLPLLQALSLSDNNLLSGTLPECIGNLTKLEILFLDGCGFSGSITHIHWENLVNLRDLDLTENLLNGSLPMSLFSLPSIESLEFTSNRFSGQLGEVEVSANLRDLDLSSNKLEGPVPKFILNLRSLTDLSLSYNNFSGTIDLIDLFQNLGNLSSIDLSFNSLSLIQSVGFSSSTIMSSFPPLEYVNLASCNMKEFPSFLKNRSIGSLDLSENKIYGQIPNWIWETAGRSLDLSRNSLIGFETLLPNASTYLDVLNLKSNLLQGQIPLELGNYFSDIVVLFLSLSNNNFHGTIPQWLCNIGNKDFEIAVDLSNNSLSGMIPHAYLQQIWES